MSSNYQTAFYQLSIILAWTVFDYRGFQSNAVVTLIMFGIFIIESSIKNNIPTEIVSCAIIIFASIALILIIQYQDEYSRRISFLKTHTVYVMSQNTKTNQRVHTKFNAFLVNFETPFEKAINIIKAVLEETTLDVMQEKCLLTALDFLSAQDIMVPDFNSNVKVDMDQQVC